jgi:hypothetical protein
VIKRKPNLQIWILVFLLSIGFVPTTTVRAQADKAAALKQSLAANQKRLMQYQWTETATMMVNGAQESQTQKAVRYDPDGQLQKMDLTKPTQQPSPRGGVAAKKREEQADYMKRAVLLADEYVPPDSKRVDAATAAGAMAKSTTSGAQLWMGNYLKNGDTVGVEMKGDAIDRIHVDTYLVSKDEKITLDAGFTSLPDGTNYASQIIIVVVGKGIQVMVENSNFTKPMTKSAPPPQLQLVAFARVECIMMRRVWVEPASKL